MKRRGWYIFGIFIAGLSKDSDAEESPLKEESYAQCICVQNKISLFRVTITAIITKQLICPILLMTGTDPGLKL